MSQSWKKPTCNAFQKEAKGGKRKISEGDTNTQESDRPWDDHGMNWNLKIDKYVGESWSCSQWEEKGWRHDNNWIPREQEAQTMRYAVEGTRNNYQNDYEVQEIINAPFNMETKHKAQMKIPTKTMMS